MWREKKCKKHITLFYVSSEMNATQDTQKWDIGSHFCEKVF